MSLHEIQSKVHVGKSKVNTFGGYNYRTAEGILAAIKAALPDGATIVVSDTMQEVAGQIFVTAKATITFSDGVSHEATGHAMHPLTKKGMDPSQITGSASSYARKYALGGLIAIDDGSADPDAAKKPYESDDKPNSNSDTRVADSMISAIREFGVANVTGDQKFKKDFAALQVSNAEQAARVQAEIKTKEST